MISPPDEAISREEDDARVAAPAERPPWTRRIAPLILVAGALLAVSVLFGRMPKERDIELRLNDAATVRGLDVIWTDARSDRGEAEGTPLQSSSWHFAEGAAPRSVHTKVRLPDGSYNVEIAVDRTHGPDATRRVITLGDTDRIAVPVR
jgi:hypothetical protein